MKNKILLCLVSLSLLFGCNDKPEVQPANDDVLIIYPNPVAQVVNIQVSRDVNQPFTLSVFNTKGKQILEEKAAIRPKYFYVNLGNEAKVKYQVILQASNFRANQEILKLK